MKPTKISVEQARGEARRVHGSVSLGDDPNTSRQAEHSALRIRDLVEAFLEGHGTKLRPGIGKDFKSAIFNKQFR